MLRMRPKSTWRRATRYVVSAAIMGAVFRRDSIAAKVLGHYVDAWLTD
jgi:hypothetical protein